MTRVNFCFGGKVSEQSGWSLYQVPWPALSWVHKSRNQNATFQKLCWFRFFISSHNDSQCFMMKELNLYYFLYYLLATSPTQQCNIPYGCVSSRPGMTSVSIGTTVQCCVGTSHQQTSRCTAAPLMLPPLWNPPVNCASLVPPRKFRLVLFYFHLLGNA